MEFDAQVDDVLRELIRQPGVLGVAVVTGPDEDPFSGTIAGGVEARRPLGESAALLVRLVEPEAEANLAPALERAARELRALARLRGERIPAVALLGRAPRRKEALVARIRRLADAFVGALGATGAAVVWRHRILGEGGRLDEEHRSRLEFLCRRLDAEARRRPGTSHAEILDEEVYACSFYYDAYFVAFFDRPYARDFARYRARAVVREIATLLPHLDDGPTRTAQVKPR